MSNQESPETFAAVLAAAQRANLGGHRRSYQPKRQNTVALVAIILLGVATLIIGVGLVLLVMAAFTPNLNKKRAARRLHFFERGLILADAKGPKAVFRWDGLSVLQAITQRYANGIYVGTSYVYTLTGQDGTATKITGFYEQPGEWGPAIQNEITLAQLPGVMAALESGASLPYGPITINRGGMATGTKSISWPEIDGIDVNAGFLRIKKAGGWMRWSAKPVSAIPNFFVFLSAASHLHRLYHAAPRG